jgi:hypothetical protein
MEINLDFQIKTLDGEEMVGDNANAGKIVANLLCGKTEGMTAIKALELAMKLNKGGKVELDTEDHKALVKVIEADTNMFNIGKAQILLALQ